MRTAFDTTWTRALGAETQRAFALLGIFEPGNITSAEAAAAWNVDDRLALAHLNQLIDLSLARQVAVDLLCLHPLLADYALEMAEHLAPEERTNAHCRVADHLFRIAPRPPRNMHDMAIVLRSHNHAAQACDRVRAERVFPWFKGDMDRSVAVPGFLIDHGLHRLNLFHHRLKFKLSEGDSAYARSYQFYWLGQALDRAGELAEAEEHLQIAVELIESPEVDDEGRAIGLSKFLMGLGQLQAQLGELDKAEATFQRAIDFDRKTDIAGGVVGAHQGALIGLLQLADVFAQSVRPDGGEQAERICRDVYAEALEHGEAQVAIMALARLASQLEQTNPKQALEYIRVAKRISKARPDAFADRQGARYACLLAVCTMQLTLSGNSALDDALNWFCLAIGNAGRCEARQELGHALYQLGNLFEHYFLIDLESPLVVAWACYALSETYTKENEGGSPLNAQFRIDERIIPCIEESNRAAAAAAVATDPWGLIDAELSPYALGWRPAP